MIELKQIQYFVVCAQTGSFGKAAERLFTTQPNVSKVIKSMEADMGEKLFERYAKGIRLTQQGKHVYKYARPILENLQKLQVFDDTKEKESLLLSCNPSSWFADMFVEYYRKNQKGDLQYQVYSAGIHEIVKRVQEHSDDVGFVYVIKNQLTAFLYFLSRNYLEFVPLRMTDVMLYPGAEHPFWKNPQSNMEFSNLRLIQSFPDEFSMDNYWNIQDENGHLAADAQTVVTTNSDYIMERILQTSDLVNISGNYLTSEHSQSLTGVELSNGEEQRIMFGYVKRKGEEIPKRANDFIHFLNKKLAAEGTEG